MRIKQKYYMMASSGLAVLLATMNPLVALASGITGRLITNDDGLTALFNTYAFSGSMETIAKVPWIGTFLSGIISVACLIGLVTTCFGIIMSMLYLSAKSLFDRVHEIKSAGKGQKFFGIQAMGSEIFNGNFGTGLDAIVGFVLALLPDVREYSYFKEGDMAYNLKENETVTTFILKISLPTIMTVFFFSIGFNGVLWQAYGNVVDAMGIAAETFVDTELSQYVERALNTGASYKFGFKAAGTSLSKKCDKIASKLYSEARKNTADVSTEMQGEIGKSIDKWVTGNFYKDQSKWAKTLGFTGEDADYENMVVEVIINNTKSEYGDDNSVIDISDNASKVFGYNFTKAGQDATVHVLVSRKVKSSSPNYFTVKESKGSGSGNSGDGTVIDPIITEVDE
ncbi:hypothetical protein AALB53_08425 [Lachnospiraceae bacterium 47-T17]